METDESKTKSLTLTNQNNKSKTDKKK